MNANEIQMFASATEIQDLWTPSLCDRVCLKTNHDPTPDHIVRETLAKFDSKYIRKWCTWLPYQHQLQSLFAGNTSPLVFGWMYLRFVCPESYYLNTRTYDAVGTYRRKVFRSIDVATLGLVMRTRYNKYWWNGEWHNRKVIV